MGATGLHENQGCAEVSAKSERFRARGASIEFLNQGVWCATWRYSGT